MEHFKEDYIAYDKAMDGIRRRRVRGPLFH